ncbi:ester cyclase [Nocardioides endophyticus]|uniref:Ester cyclase n=1 Tax=Nocardioides endophyticus TaxID=1353775 RepID=A0ABP8Y6J5_9ACTN
MSYRHKAAFCRFLDQALNNGRLEVIDELFAEDFVGHFPEWSEPRVGPGSVEDWVETVRRGFPDVNALVEGNWMTAEVDVHHVGKGVTADRLAAYVVLRGTHLGEFCGIEPSHEPIEVPQVHLLEFRGEQIVRDVVVCDRLAFLPAASAAPSLEFTHPRTPSVLI